MNVLQCVVSSAARGEAPRASRTAARVARRQETGMGIACPERSTPAMGGGGGRMYTRRSARSPKPERAELMRAPTTVLFLITARGGSKGVPGKNLRAVGGSPLVGRAARTARQAARRLAGGGHRVVCSTDAPELAAVARAWGAEVPILRPAALATDAADSADVALHALDWHAARGERFGALALLQPTTPLAAPEDLLGALALFAEGGGAPVATVSPGHHPYWTYHLDGGRLRPAVPAEREVLRRQDEAPCYALNGAAFVVDPEAFRHTRRFVEPVGTLAFVMPAERGIDVDTEADLVHAEALLAAPTPAPIALGPHPIGPGPP